ARSAPASAFDVGGRAATRRDRALPAATAATPDHGRADIGPDAASSRETVRDPASAVRRRLLDPVYQPQARRDPRAVPEGNGAARRPRHGYLRPATGNILRTRPHDDRRRLASSAAPRGADAR